jgi:hypothetical protein
VLYGVILANKSQICDFLVMVQSERFAGFSGEGKWVIGAEYGVIIPMKEHSFFLGIYTYDTPQIHQYFYFFLGNIG